MVQTAIARAMASTFTRRVDGMFKVRRSKEPQLWLILVLLQKCPIRIRTRDRVLFREVLCREVWYTFLVGWALIDSKSEAD